MSIVRSGIALFAVATIALCSPAAAQSDAPNPHPLTGHGVAQIQARCAPGFTPSSTSIGPGGHYTCHAPAPTICEGSPSLALAPSNTMQSGSMSCTVPAPCPAGFTASITATGSGSAQLTCQSQQFVCAAGSSQGKLNFGGSINYDCDVP